MKNNGTTHNGFPSWRNLVHLTPKYSKISRHSACKPVSFIKTSQYCWITSLEQSNCYPEDTPVLPRLWRQVTVTFRALYRCTYLLDFCTTWCWAVLPIRRQWQNAVSTDKVSVTKVKWFKCHVNLQCLCKVQTATIANLVAIEPEDLQWRVSLHAPFITFSWPQQQ